MLTQSVRANGIHSTKSKKRALVNLSLGINRSNIVLPTFSKDIEASFHQHVLKDLVLEKDAMGSLQAKMSDIDKQQIRRKETLKNDMYSQNQDYIQGQEAANSFLRTAFRKHILGFFRKANRAVRTADRDRRQEQENLEEVNPHYTVQYSADYKLRKSQKSKNKVAEKTSHPDPKSQEGLTFVGVLQEFWQFSSDVVERKKEISLLGENKITLHYEVPQNTLYFDLDSPLFVSRLRHRVSNQPLPFSGSTELTGDATTIDISRDIPIFELSTGLSYGVDSKTIGYGISRQIIGPLNAQISRTSHLSQNLPTDTTLRLNLGFGF